MVQKIHGSRSRGEDTQQGNGDKGSLCSLLLTGVYDAVEARGNRQREEAYRFDGFDSFFLLNVFF